jgi:predicted GH43/DUF377 family glycosyl hydrolase
MIIKTELSMKKTIILIVIFMATACSVQQTDYWGFGDFYKPDENPIMKADSSYTFLCPVRNEMVQWQKADIFNPGAVVKDGKICMLFRAEDNPEAILGRRTSRIGLAHSEDGINFTKHPEPVLYPDSGAFMKFDYPGGCEDPRVVETEDGMFVMTYTSWNYETARLSIAFSKDLMKWEKKGPAFMKAYDGRFLDLWSKSGSIVTRMEEDRQVVAKIDGKYWMYWGEDFVNLAWSDNLSDWYPLLDDSDELLKLISTRKGKFDSRLTECGPPAVILNNGIVLFYNGKNAEDDNHDPKLPKGTYSVGMVVFNPDNPRQVLYRSDTCLLKPTLPHEITGQYAAGTTFSEGLVYYKSRWFMYYGTADSYVGVAVSE